MVKREMGSHSPSPTPTPLTLFRFQLPNGQYFYFGILDNDEKPKQHVEEDHKDEKLEEEEEEEEEEELRWQEAIFHLILSMDSSPALSLHKSKKALQQEEVVDYKKKGIISSFPLEYTSYFEHWPWPSTHEFGECSHSSCVICADTKSSASMIRIHKCNHYVCQDCILIYVGEKLQENIAEIKCPESKCKVSLDLKFFEDLIPKEVLDQWQDALREAWALATPRFIVCPFRDCSALFRDDGKPAMIRACPKCWKLYCSRCRDSCHLGINCYLSQRLKMRQQAQRRQLIIRQRSTVVYDVDSDNDLDLDLDLDLQRIIKLFSSKNE